MCGASGKQQDEVKRRHCNSGNSSFELGVRARLKGTPPVALMIASGLSVLNRKLSGLMSLSKEAVGKVCKGLGSEQGLHAPAAEG